MVIWCKKQISVYRNGKKSATYVCLWCSWRFLTSVIKPPLLTLKKVCKRSDKTFLLILSHCACFWIYFCYVKLLHILFYNWNCHFPLNTTLRYIDRNMWKPSSQGYGAIFSVAILAFLIFDLEKKTLFVQSKRA